MTLIESLLELHKVDLQVRGLQARLDAADRYLKAQTRELDALSRRHEELQQRHRQVQATIANHEMEVTAADERLEKLRDELNSAVNSKQYNAVLAELNTIKEHRTEIEDKIIAEMEQLEQLAADVESLELQVAERSKVRDHASAQYQERLAEVGDRLEELKGERATAAAVVPEKVITIYDELADAYDGEAMAQINELDRRNREYICDACNIQVPFEQVSTLISSGDRVHQCPSCKRILYLHDEMRGALAKR